MLVAIAEQMMQARGNLKEAEAGLLWGWLTARSVARGLPLPVADHGGMRVDTALPHETRRYVFAWPSPGVPALALSISAPHIPIKVCCAGEQLLALMPPGWQLQPASYLMSHDGTRDSVPITLAGYRLEVVTGHPANVARFWADDGSLAASGYAVEHDGYFIFDRIVVDNAHQRRGLGRALMAALAATQASRVARRVLVATEAGRALYSTSGWIVSSPYSTVEYVR